MPGPLTHTHCAGVLFCPTSPPEHGVVVDPAGTRDVLGLRQYVGQPTSTRQSPQVFLWATSLPLKGVPPRLRPPALHKHQLTRHAWIASPSMTTSSPCIPSMPLTLFLPACAQVWSTQSTSASRSRPRCWGASFIDTSTSRPRRPLGLCQYFLVPAICAFQDAHEDVLSFLRF